MTEYLATSYYCLYKTDKNIQELQHQSKKEPKEKDALWTEFQWTEDKLNEVKETLSNNELQSSIHSNHHSGRGQYMIDKLEKEAHLNWDRFYTSHQTNFFKDRHYLHKTFPDEFGCVYGNVAEEVGSKVDGDIDNTHGGKKIGAVTVEEMNNVEPFTIVEIGCGVGNTVLPLLELDPIMSVNDKNGEPDKRKICVWGLDFSKVAVDLLRKDERYIQAEGSGRAFSGVWDITKSHPTEIHSSLHKCSNVSLLLFCLSAVSPEKMPNAAKHVAATIKPGGTLVLRDYGRLDEAQLKLSSSRGKMLSENFYVKHDSTRVYYFDLDDLEKLFGKEGAGLECIEKKYIQRVYKNRSDNSERRRVWVQARFRKPI